MLTQRRAGGGILFYSFPSVIQYKRASVCPSVYCYIALRPIIEYIASLLTSEDIRDICKYNNLCAFFSYMLQGAQT